MFLLRNPQPTPREMGKLTTISRSRFGAGSAAAVTSAFRRASRDVFLRERARQTRLGFAKSEESGKFSATSADFARGSSCCPRGGHSSSASRRNLGWERASPIERISSPALKKPGCCPLPCPSVREREPSRSGGASEQGRPGCRGRRSRWTGDSRGSELRFSS